MSAPQSVSVQQLAAGDVPPAQLDILDVRTPREFGEIHATPARNVPLDKLDPDAVIRARQNAADQPLYVICQSGTRSAMAQQKFLAAGYAQVIQIAGGTQAWAAAGLPVVEGKQAISLERQVRITAGGIVLAGAVATLVTGNVYFASIPAFVGAGLMFAGITNTCGMALLLAKMPWNQVPDAES